MLAHILALTVGLLSFALYMSAFFFPEVYRKSDLTWSGIGLFYALVLWVCAGRITGGVLLGQTASVALLGWLGWQTINLRRELAPIALRTPLPNEAKTIGQAVQFKLGELRSRWRQTKLAEQTNQLAATIAGWTNSIAKPKKQPPPVGGRSRQSKKVPVAQPVPEIPVAEMSEVADAVSESASEPVTADTVAEIVQPIRPARQSGGLLGGLRRNAAKAKPPAQAKAPQRPTPPVEPSPDLDEFENWEDETAIEPAAIEEVVVVVETDESATQDVVLVVETDDAVATAETRAIEDVVVVVETDDPPIVEVIEIEVVEAVPPAQDLPEGAIESEAAEVGSIDAPPDADEPFA